MTFHNYDYTTFTFVRTLTARKVPSIQQELFFPLASDNILGRRYCCVSMEGGGRLS